MEHKAFKEPQDLKVQQDLKEHKVTKEKTGQQALKVLMVLKVT